MARRSYDVIIIGSGATGGWAAKTIAEGGARVLVLEAGPRLAPSALGPEVWSPEERYRGGLTELRARQAVQSTHPAFHRLNHHLFVDDVAHPYRTPQEAPFSWIRSRQVGGRTLLWMGTTPRMSDFELKAASRDGVGLDWPIGQMDLDPHYARVERSLGVMGMRDGLEELPDGDFRPPSAMTEAEQAFKRAVEQAWPERKVIAARGVPVRTAGEAWRADAGWPPFTSPGSTLAEAERTGNLTVREDAIVRRLEIDPTTRLAKGVEVIDRRDRSVHSLSGEIVILCCSTIESVRLLLLSKISDPSGWLGRGLMDHPTVALHGSLPGFTGSTGVEELNGPNGIYIPRFRNLRDREPGFLRGYGIWGRLQRGVGRSDGTATFALAACCEMLPSAENRVVLDPTLVDQWGTPAVCVDCRLGENERAMQEDAAHTMRSMIECVGGRVEREWRTVPGLMIHEVGGARMGGDPATSVVDDAGRLWNVRNVFVADGATWPSCGYQNPTLTMMALALRTGETVLRQLGAI